MNASANTTQRDVMRCPSNRWEETDEKKFFASTVASIDELRTRKNQHSCGFQGHN
jgi:hypothetical protein